MPTRSPEEGVTIQIAFDNHSSIKRAVNDALAEWLSTHTAEVGYG